MEITKQIIKVGNGAGVLVPREWLNGTAKVQLIEKPLNIKEDIINILDPYLPNILSVMVVGSYARGEQTQRSDIDVLVITDSIKKTIKKGKYDFILISKDSIEKALENNILPILPMLKEAKPIINASLIRKYAETPLTKKNLAVHTELTKSAMNVVKEHLKLSIMMKEKIISEGFAYSLGLRMRQVYIVDCLINKKSQSNKELKKVILKVTGSLGLYEGYLRVKDDKKAQKKLPLEEAQKALAYVIKKIKEQEKWIKRTC